MADNKVAIVTGVGRNIGEAIARRLARDGFRIGCVDMDESRARAISKAINDEAPGQALPVVCDVSASDQVEQMVDAVHSEWGRIDALVNNVAITDRGNVYTVSEDEWDRVMRITVKSVFLCVKHVAPKMRDGGGGVIVNIGSTSGHLGRDSAVAYPAAKAAVRNLSRALAMQLGPDGIRVNMVTPNKVGSPVGMDAVRTDADVDNLVGRAGRPEDIAGAVSDLMSADAVFVDGANILVDGGAMAALRP